MKKHKQLYQQLRAYLIYRIDNKFINNYVYFWDDNDIDASVVDRINVNLRR